MRVLLDANIPTRFKLSITGHDVRTAREERLNELPDGQLIDAIGRNFDVLVTMDKNLPFQQRLNDRPFAVVVLRANSNRLRDILPLVPELLLLLPKVKPGEVRVVVRP